MASRKLKPYFQAHPIKVIIGQPIRKVIESRNRSTRMTEWTYQLADFGLEYEPRRAIKAKALADFISECSSRPTDGEGRESWELQVDGSATKAGSGAGLIIISFVGDKMEYAVKFDFMASNNEAKYEALVPSLQICINSRAQVVMAKSDSQLIQGRVSGKYEAKEDNMRMDLNKLDNSSRSYPHSTYIIFRDQKTIKQMPWPVWPARGRG